MYFLIKFKTISIFGGCLVGCIYACMMNWRCMICLNGIVPKLLLPHKLRDTKWTSNDLKVHRPIKHWHEKCTIYENHA